MDTNKFWNLYGSKSQKKLGEEDEGTDWESITCPIDEGHLRGGKRLTNLSVILPGSSVNSFVWTWASQCLIQDHVLDSFRSHGLTGFDVKPCKARFKKDIGKQPPNLWELIVTGWAGMAPPESGVKLVEYCEGCKHMVYSMFTEAEKLIDAKQWDGSDFFMVWPLPRFVFITDRAAEIIQKASWKDSQILSLADLQARALKQRKYVGDILSPGRLSYVMQDDRARQLGCPLGIY